MRLKVRCGSSPSHSPTFAEVTMLARPTLTRPVQDDARKPKSQARPTEERFLLRVGSSVAAKSNYPAMNPLLERPEARPEVRSRSPQAGWNRAARKRLTPCNRWVVEMAEIEKANPELR